MSSDLTAVSLCAGVGGFDLALRRCGIRVVAAVEIDPDCRGVLARHFPEAHLFNDLTEVTGDQLRAAGFVPGRGIVCAGWPCQGNSVAGTRGGMADPRSGLWRHVVRVLAEARPAWFIGENVPGLLSVNGGDDIAVVRRDLAQLGYWWAERILDSQYLGVAQRRRRLFFVGCPGDRSAPVEVLLEPEGGERHPAASREARPGASRRASGSAGGSGTAAPLTTRAYADQISTEDNLVTAATLQGGGRRGHRIDAEGAAGGHLIPFDTVQITSGENRSNPKAGDPAPTLNGNGLVHVAPLPLSVGAGSQTSAAITAHHGKGPDSDATNGLIVASFPQVTHSLAVAGDFSTGEDVAQTVRSANGQPGCDTSGLAVRRLTPMECERLQGFPDEWTRWKLVNGDLIEQSDSARYREIGNAVTVDVLQWIARRLVIADTALSRPAEAAAS